MTHATFGSLTRLVVDPPAEPAGLFISEHHAHAAAHHAPDGVGAAGHGLPGVIRVTAPAGGRVGAEDVERALALPRVDLGRVGARHAEAPRVRVLDARVVGADVDRGTRRDARHDREELAGVAVRSRRRRLVRAGAVGLADVRRGHVPVVAVRIVLAGRRLRAVADPVAVVVVAAAAAVDHAAEVLTPHRVLTAPPELGGAALGLRVAVLVGRAVDVRVADEVDVDERGIDEAQPDRIRIAVGLLVAGRDLAAGAHAELERLGVALRVLVAAADHGRVDAGVRLARVRRADVAVVAVRGGHALQGGVLALVVEALVARHRVGVHALRVLVAAADHGRVDAGVRLARVRRADVAVVAVRGGHALRLGAPLVRDAVAVVVDVVAQLGGARVHGVVVVVAVAPGQGGLDDGDLHLVHARLDDPLGHVCGLARVVGRNLGQNGVGVHVMQDHAEDVHVPAGVLHVADVDRVRLAVTAVRVRVALELLDVRRGRDVAPRDVDARLGVLHLPAAEAQRHQAQEHAHRRLLAEEFPHVSHSPVEDRHTHRSVAFAFRRDRLRLT